MTFATEDWNAADIAAAVKAGETSARQVVQAALARIEARNDALGAFTDVTATRAFAKADAIDAARARGEALGPLAGAPFAAKNLFDIAGLPTRAGSKINRDPRCADGGGGSDSRRRPQHGRIRL
jgi:1-carboxybiuret hydrolase